jgi:excisionase family DNA binding protein
METVATMSVEAAGRELGISRGLAYRLARAGKLPVLRLGRRLRICRPALEKLLAEPSSFERPAAPRRRPRK